jgi:hypothetical protein
MKTITMIALVILSVQIKGVAQNNNSQENEIRDTKVSSEDIRDVKIFGSEIRDAKILAQVTTKEQDERLKFLNRGKEGKQLLSYSEAEKKQAADENFIHENSIVIPAFSAEEQIQNLSGGLSTEEIFFILLSVFFGTILGYRVWLMKAVRV